MDDSVISKGRRFAEAVNYLRVAGIISTQKDVAAAMHSTQQNISAAMNGREGVLTDKFIMRLANTYKIFNAGYLLFGEGTLLNGKAPDLVTDTDKLSSPESQPSCTSVKCAECAMLKKMQEQIDRLISVVENLTNQ